MALLDSAHFKTSKTAPFKSRFFLWKKFAWLLASLQIAAASAQTQHPAAEYKLKAVFLYNFAQFVEWPETAYPNPISPFVIGIIGNDPFGTFLDQIVRNESVKGHPIEVRRFKSINQIESCQILFISRSESERTAAMLRKLKGKPILTVGEAENFAIVGGMIRFITERNKVKFRINVEAARASGLTISSKLLRVSEIVVTEKEQ
jgi:hypothetical protein